MPDIRSILDPLPVDNEIKARAWDAYEAAKTPEEFQSQLDPLPLPKEVKANLWDAKFQLQPVQGATPEDSRRELARFGLSAQPPQPPEWEMRGANAPNISARVTNSNLAGLLPPPGKPTQAQAGAELDRLAGRLPATPRPSIVPKRPDVAGEIGLITPQPTPMGQDANAALQGTGLQPRAPRMPVLPNVDERPWMDRPILDPRLAPKGSYYQRSLAGEVGEPQSAQRVISTGIASGIEAGAGLLTPRNVGIAGALGAVNVAGAALAPVTGGASVAAAGGINAAATLYFTYEMTKSTLESAPEAMRAIQEGDYETAARIIGPAAVNAALSYGLVKHVAKPGIDAVASYRRGNDLFKAQQRHLDEVATAEKPIDRAFEATKVQIIGNEMGKLPEPSLLPPVPSPSGVTNYVRAQNEIGPAATVLPNKLFGLSNYQRRLIETLGPQQANLLPSRLTEPQRASITREMESPRQPLTQAPTAPKAPPPAISKVGRFGSERGTAAISESPTAAVVDVVAGRDAVKDTLASLERNFADRFSDIRRFTELADLAPDKDPYIAARLYAGRGGKIERRLRRPGGLKDVIQPAYKKGYLRDMTEYSLYERYEELAGRGIDRFPDGRSIQDIQASKIALEQRLGPQKLAQVKASIDGLRDYSARLLREARDGGLISDEAYKAVRAKNQKYVPLQRLEFIADQLENMPIGSNLFSVASQDLVKAIHGSERKVLDPIQGIIRNVYKTVALVERNKVALRMADLADNPAFAGQVVKLSKQSPHAPYGMEKFSVMRDGVKEEYAAPQLVVDAMKGLTNKQMDLVTRMASKSSGWLRAGATSLNAAFIPSNAIRDFQTAHIVSEVGFSPLDWVRGIAEEIRRGPDYDRYLESGAAFSGYMEQLKSLPSKAKELTGQMTLGKAFNAVNPLAYVRFIGEKIEMAPRLGTFKRALRKGRLMEDAGFVSRNATVDFAKAGSTMKVMNLWVPFLNARLQGTLNIAGALKDHPGRAAAVVTAMIGVPTIATYYHNTTQHADIWNNIADFEKQNNFIIIFGDEKDEEGNPTQVVKIPKGDAKIFGNPIESFLEYLDGTNPKSARRLAVQWVSDVLPVSFERDGELSLSMFASSVLPPAAKALLVEPATNQNLYTGKSIVPLKGRLQQASSHEQYKSTTPKTVVKIAQFLGLSPLKLENSLGTQFGGLGRQLMPAADLIFYGETKAKGPLKQVTGRFLGAKAGGEEERMFQELEAASQDNADEYARAHRNAEGLLNSLTRAPQEKRLEMFQQFVEVEAKRIEQAADPIEKMKAERILAGSVKTLADMIEAEAEGLTTYEKVLRSKPVEVRAEIALRRLNAMAPERKAETFERWVSIGILTDDVADAMVELIEGIARP